jgi:hypothetical protein
MHQHKVHVINYTHSKQVAEPLRSALGHLPRLDGPVLRLEVEAKNDAHDDTHAAAANAVGGASAPNQSRNEMSHQMPHEYL